ncbi:ComF family protein [Pleionea litopenaei]|uniref:ComF family protein n=1 Tax=Pleionea litopenaei TaxID=3070815 RepID=A0AA51X8A7_9GAMM|nr:ComF family protein [Pleionea sp. HL-JVS1]WMS89182.1 ComF family protein [Pleionea sp. HL-JVS1]
MSLRSYPFMQALLPPSSCALCHQAITSRRWLCTACHSSLPQDRRHCLSCSAPIINRHQQTQESRCGQCLISPPSIDRLISVFEYDYPIDWWITQFKFQQNTRLASWFGFQIFQKIICDSGVNVDCLIPIPLHSKRLKMRGFNQSQLLARNLAKRLNLPYRLTSVKRIKPTQAQSGLSENARRRNLNQAFSIVEAVAPRIALIDDVYTTGSTVNSLAKAFKAAGCRYVEAWVIAQAPRKR